MLSHNKKFLRQIALLLLFLYFIITTFFYYILQNIVFSQNKQKLYNILLYTQAQKAYIDKYQKKFIFSLQNQNILPKDFFHPIIMSATYITRHTLEEYNNLRKDANLTPIFFKIASDNPRNPVNRASEEELELLKKFNEKNITSFSKNIKINGENFIYYAVPVTPNNETCMRCHSDPKLAPKDLVKMYGPKAGFNEKIGHIRAFFSLTLPLEEEYKIIKKISIIFDIILGIVFIFWYIVSYFIVKKLDKKDRDILNSANIDGLTQIYNRKKFNEDMQLKICKDSFLLLIDIDHFKKINDSFGHPTGDYVLKKVSELISENLKKGDKFYRIGGEEFAIISVNTSEKEEIEFANKLKDLIKNYTFKDVGNISISIGIAKFHEGEESLQWYKRADEALYEAKKKRDMIVYKN